MGSQRHLFAINDALVSWLLKGPLTLMLIVGLIWKALAAWNLWRTRVPAVGSP